VCRWLALRGAAADITAFADFPVARWKKIWFTNPLECVNKEIKRRTDVVAPAQTLPPCSASPEVLVEIHDEWQVGDRRYLSEGSMATSQQTNKIRRGGGATSTPHGLINTLKIDSLLCSVGWRRS